MRQIGDLTQEGYFW